MEIAFKKVVRAILLYTPFLSISVQASEATIPYSFQPGSPARASEVNANFDAVKYAINDNNSRLHNHDVQLKDHETRLKALESYSDLSTLIIGSWTAKSFNNGFHGENGSITFHANGSFSLNSGTISVLVGCAITCPASGGTWEIIEGGLIKLTLDGVEPISNRPYGSGYAFPIIAQQNQLLLTKDFNMTLLIRQ